MGNYTIFGGFENPRRGRQARNFTTSFPGFSPTSPTWKFYNKCSENSRPQIVFRTDIIRKLTLGAPVQCSQFLNKYLSFSFSFQRYS